MGLWILQPIIFIIGIITFIKNDKPFVKYFTRQDDVKLFNDSSKTVYDIPTDMEKILRLGELQHIILNNQNDTKLTNESLVIASSVLNVPTLTIQEFNDVLDQIKTTGKTNGLLDKLLGFFSFVNVLWIISIIGMAVLFFPALYSLIGSLAEDILKLIIKFSFLIEPCSYAFCYYLVVSSTKYGSNTKTLNHSVYSLNTGIFIAFAGLALYTAATIYSYSKYEKKDKKVSMDLLYVFTIIPYYLMAYYYQSVLLGFCSVIAFYSMLGFGVRADTLSLYIGFANDDIMERICLISSLMILILFTSGHTLPRDIVYPVSTALYIFGPITYYLALLIMSSKYYARNDYFKMQLTMIVSLVIGLFIGGTFNIASLFNVSITFMCLYLTDKTTEIVIEKYTSICLFGLSLLLYKVSMYLHTHPEFVINMFNFTDTYLKN
jgi:hypothetical protein